MIKKLITLFKLGRKIAKSDILNITSKFQEPPLIVKIVFKIEFETKKHMHCTWMRDANERLGSSLPYDIVFLPIVAKRRSISIITTQKKT